GSGFPEKVTAFRDGMAVHGRYNKPCPVCGSPVQRIVYSENETNYCARCQTGGRLLADRALSRLLHGGWPKSIDELYGRAAARSVLRSAGRLPLTFRKQRRLHAQNMTITPLAVDFPRPVNTSATQTDD